MFHNYRHLFPSARVPLVLSAVSGPVTDGVHFAQTLCFPEFNAGPPRALAFKAFLLHNRSLLRVWRTPVLLTTVFVEWIAPRLARAQKSAFLYYFLCALRENHYKTYSK